MAFQQGQLALLSPRHDHFDREAVTRLIFARLPPGAFKSRGQLAWMAFRRQPYQWAAIGAIVLSDAQRQR